MHFSGTLSYERSSDRISKIEEFYFWEYCTLNNLDNFSFSKNLFLFITQILFTLPYFLIELLLLPVCRFGTIAYLQQTWWFEVSGEVEFPLPAGTYSLFFRLQLGKSTKRFGRQVCNSQNVHGWDIKPVQFQLSTSENQNLRTTSSYLREPGNWNYYHGGDFVVENSGNPAKIKFSMMQIDCTHNKGGLSVDSLLIYPAEFKERLKRFWLLINLFFVEI